MFVTGKPSVVNPPQALPHILVVFVFSVPPHYQNTEQVRLNKRLPYPRFVLKTRYGEAFK